MVKAKPTAINLSMVSSTILQEWSFLKQELNSETIDPVSSGNCPLTKKIVGAHAQRNSAWATLFGLRALRRQRDLRHPLLLRDGTGERSKFDDTVFDRKQVGDPGHAAELAYSLFRRLPVQIPIDFAKKS